MYKFATNAFAFVGIFSMGAISGAMLIVSNHDRKEAEKSARDEKNLDDLNKAWSDVQATIN